MIKRSTILLGSFLVGAASLNAQEFFNNGGTVQINGIVVFVNGGIENNSAGTIVNDGNFWSTNNGIAPGSLTLNGGSATSGTGKFYVEQDFVNNASWNGAGNEVLMNSNAALQNITGTSATSFFHLTLTPSTLSYPNPKVVMGINVTVTDSLWLNNRELATQTNTLTITSPTNGAITNNPAQGAEGFISSIAPGYTEWQTANASSYFFPVGSSTGTLRYRPVEITPSSAAANTFTVRFNNNDATPDGYDRTINDASFCYTNPNWYHSVARSAGATASDVKVYFDPANDGSNWNGLAEWQTTGSPAWNNIQPTVAGTASYFSTQTKSAWAFPDPGQPYILIENKPQTPAINCPGPICSNSLDNLSVTATGSASGNYTWVVPAGTTLNNGQGTSAINIDFGSASGSSFDVYAQGSDANCLSNAASCAITVVQAPDAGFTATEDQNNELIFNFQDTTNGSVTQAWDINGTSYSGSNPTHNFGAPGTYPVTLIVSNGACVDTAMTTIVVDYSEILIIPNVMSPNGDGINDQFFITHNGFKEFKITILNRWGQIMYSADAPSFHWDGKDPDGDIVSDGTYYYMLKGVSLNNKAVEQEGYLMVYKSN
jgi:gliding motility-associated-like protein